LQRLLDNSLNNKHQHKVGVFLVELLQFSKLKYKEDCSEVQNLLQLQEVYLEEHLLTSLLQVAVFLEHLHKLNQRELVGYLVEVPQHNLLKEQVDYLVHLLKQHSNQEQDYLEELKQSQQLE